MNEFIFVKRLSLPLAHIVFHFRAIMRRPIVSRAVSCAWETLYCRHKLMFQARKREIARARAVKYKLRLRAL